jgi:hypothetical protein
VQSRSLTAPDSGSRPVRETQRAGGAVASSPAFRIAARAGFVARAAIYLIIGALAFGLAAGIGGRATNQKGALETIARQPFGSVLLTLVAIGLGGYALWRLVRAALGRGPEAGRDSGLDRLSALASGIVYAGLCVLAVEILTTGGSGGSSGSAQKGTGGVLGWPGGQWLVGIAGAILIGVGLYQGYRALSRDFLEDSKTERMTPFVRRWFERIAVAGYLSRMVVFGLIGVFLIKAAADYNPSKAVGLDGALAKLLQQTYGPVLLGVVAAGLIAFGLYSLADARYRRI